MFDQDSIREDLIIQKETDNLSFTYISNESGVSRSTLCRFARHGGKMDIDNLIKLSNFLGITNLSGGIESDGNTLENIKDAIRFDKNLMKDQKVKLWRIFNAAYRILTSD